MTDTVMPPPSVGKEEGLSDLQRLRLSYNPPLPRVLSGKLKPEFETYVDGDSSSGEISELFPNLFGQPLVNLLPREAEASFAFGKPLKIGVVLSGGQAPGGHNVIAGIFDCLDNIAPGSILLGFKGGVAGIMSKNAVNITRETLYSYRNQGGFDIIGSGRDKIETANQLSQVESACSSFDLDGLVVIGGDDSNTNACFLAEYFRSKNLKTRVVGCPKTIDGDLKCKTVPISFGFDSACKVFSELIGNIMIDSRSSRKYYHFIRLMGRSASHIALECAIQTHPNVALIGEEVLETGQTISEIVSSLADVVCKRAKSGLNFGVFLIPEGIVDFIPEVHGLVSELNDILSRTSISSDGQWKQSMEPVHRQLLESLPEEIQSQLLMERDPHGNVQVSRIQSEKLLISLVEKELLQRKTNGEFTGKFQAISHFFGYEGRSGLPSNFDCNYCYALGFAAVCLIATGQTGYIASVGNLTAAVEDWTVGGTPMTSLMHMERRKGKLKAVIRKATVDLAGPPFRHFAAQREKWATGDYFCSPGPIQFSGPTADSLSFTLKLETNGSL